MSTCKLLQDPAKVKEKMESDDGRWAVAFARIEWYVRGESVHLSQIRLYSVYTIALGIRTKLCSLYIYVLYYLHLYLQYVSVI